MAAVRWIILPERDACMFKGAEILEKVRRERPLIHHITNVVTCGDCADITASIGALPVMAFALEEVEEMVQAASAAVINTGTLLPNQLEAMIKMGKKAGEKGIPVVLDPVGAGATAYRSKAALDLLKIVKPVIIKGNGAEIGSLAGVKGVRISGIQSIDAGDPLEGAGRLHAVLDYRAVIAVTGPVDVITDGKRVARVYNGHSYLPLVVGSGCMSASLVAAFAAVEKDYFLAAAAALAAMGVAGEIAAEKKKIGPAEYKARLLDTLFYLNPQEFSNRARIEIR